MKRPSTGRKKPRQVWGVNAINFANGKKAPTTINVLDSMEDNSVRFENEPDTQQSAPAKKVMPACFGNQNGLRVKRA